MKAKDPMIVAHGNMLIPNLRNFIVERVEEESNLSVLEQIYAILGSSKQSFEDRYQKAKEQTEKYCVPEIAKEMEAEGYMIDKPYPFDDPDLDFDQLISEDAHDSDAPQKWVEKMFPELYA